MLTGDQYRQTLRDGRALYLDGKRVADATAHPLLRISVDWVANTYDRLRAAATGPHSAIFGAPQAAAALEEQMAMLTASDPTAASTAGCMALHAVAPDLGAVQPAYAARLRQFLDRCRDKDLRVAAARRDLGAFRIVKRTETGVVLRGVKQHVLGAAMVHEILVVPGGDLPADAADRAIACAVPVNAPGVKVVCVTTAPRSQDMRHFPISQHESMADCTVIFEDVAVPMERVFLDGETAPAGRLEARLGIWERARSAAVQADRAELLVGLAQTVADMNGVGDVDHIRDKISKLAVYAAMCRAGWQAALHNATQGRDGSILPSETYIYAVKAYGSDLYSEMTTLVMDCGGASISTAPTVADYENEDLHQYVEKYMSTGKEVPGVDRMKVFHLIRDLTADTYAGWNRITSQLVGGGISAQRISTLDHYPIDGVKEKVRAAAGI